MKLNNKNNLIYDFLKHIPKGKVTTYGKIAKILKIKSPRIVGNILHKNNKPEKYPCHRVVRSDGSIASGYAFGGKKEQIRKLKEEGVIFKNNKVNMEKCLFCARGES